MWCHLCTQDYPDFEDFRIHIMEKHRNASNFCKNNSDSESAHENAETSEIDDESAAFITFEGNCYESDHNIDAEIKSDTSMDGNDNIGAEIKSDDSMDADDNTVLGNNSDHTIATKNKSNLSKAALNNLPEKSHDNEAGTSVIKNTMLKKRRPRCNKENKTGIKATASKKSPKKLKMPSILKKRGRKKQMKVSFSRKALPKRKMSAFSYQGDIPEDSDGHSESSFNGLNKVNPQSVPNNFINPPSMIPVNNYPQPISNNNPVYIVNPYGGQGMNNYVLGNQAVQPPVYVVNPVAAMPTPSQTHKCFDFHSQNILKWLTKHNELCKNIEYPLPSSLFDQVKAVHKGIFDQYCTASISEETTAVLKVYEELDCMIHKHINSINNALSIL